MTQYYAAQSGGETDSGSSTSDQTIKDAFADAAYQNVQDSIKKRSLWPRASTIFECADSEVCAVAFRTSFWCIDSKTQDFHDSYGGNGNLDSFTYTMSNGEVTKLASTVTQLPTPTNTVSGSKSTATKAGEAAMTTGATSAAVSGSGSTASSSAAARLTLGALLGVTTLAMVATGLWL